LASFAVLCAFALRIILNAKTQRTAKLAKKNFRVQRSAFRLLAVSKLKLEL
jgi:hypothetical protein